MPSLILNPLSISCNLKDKEAAIQEEQTPEILPTKRGFMNTGATPNMDSVTSERLKFNIEECKDRSSIDINDIQDLKYYRSTYIKSQNVSKLSST